MLTHLIEACFRGMKTIEKDGKFNIVDANYFSSEMSGLTQKMSILMQSSSSFSVARRMYKIADRKIDNLCLLSMLFALITIHQCYVVIVRYV